MTTLTSFTEKMEFTSEISNLPQIEQLIDLVCDKHHISEDNYGNILIALTEAVNNAIIHGNKQDPTKTVLLQLQTKNDDVFFIVQDEGSGFEYNNVPDPTLPQNINKLNGRGVFLMKSLADEVCFEENGSKVKLRFSLLNN